MAVPCVSMFEFHAVWNHYVYQIMAHLREPSSLAEKGLKFLFVSVDTAYPYVIQLEISGKNDVCIMSGFMFF